MKPVCFIPARGGSKRIPGKNKKKFCGIPIIVWVIEAAQKSGLFEYIVVSTDDSNISNIAYKMNCRIDSRPPEMYGDMVDTETIAAHVIEAFGLIDEDAFCMLYSTAVFTKPKWLIETFFSFDGHPINVAKPTQHPMQRALIINKDGFLEPVDISAIKQRTQDLPQTYFDVGDFYWMRPRSFVEKWREGVDLLRQDCRPFIVGKYDTWDLDDPEDWEHGEHEFRRLGE
jgi:N-acylneuraminate cytidylyltransferase